MQEKGVEIMKQVSDITDDGKYRSSNIKEGQQIEEYQSDSARKQQRPHTLKKNFSVVGFESGKQLVSSLQQAKIELAVPKKIKQQISQGQANSKKYFLQTMSYTRSDTVQRKLDKVSSQIEVESEFSDSGCFSVCSSVSKNLEDFCLVQMADRLDVELQSQKEVRDLQEQIALLEKLRTEEMNERSNFEYKLKNQLSLMKYQLDQVALGKIAREENNQFRAFGVDLESYAGFIYDIVTKLESQQYTEKFLNQEKLTNEVQHYLISVFVNEANQRASRGQGRGTATSASPYTPYKPNHSDSTPQKLYK